MASEARQILDDYHANRLVEDDGEESS